MSLLVVEVIAGDVEDVGRITKVCLPTVCAIDNGYGRVVQVELYMYRFTSTLHKIVSCIGFQEPVVHLPDDTGKGGIQFPKHHEVIFIDWLIPLPNEEFPDYVKRMAERVDDSEPFYLLVSCGPATVCV